MYDEKEDYINLEEYLRKETHGEQIKRLGLFGVVTLSTIAYMFTCPACSMERYGYVRFNQLCWGQSCSRKVNDFLSECSTITDDKMREKFSLWMNLI